MSSHTQPIFSTNDNRPATVQAAHAHLAERIGENKPRYLPASHVADADDFEELARHLRGILIPVADYVRTSLKDIEAQANVRIDVGCLERIMDDATAEILGSVTNAADDVRDYGRAA